MRTPARSARQRARAHETRLSTRTAARPGHRRRTGRALRAAAAHMHAHARTHPMGGTVSRSCGIVPYQLASEAQIRRLFLRFDKDEDARLNSEELGVFVRDYARTARVVPMDGAAAHLMRTYDRLNMRSLDIAQFSALVHDLIADPRRLVACKPRLAVGGGGIGIGGASQRQQPAAGAASVGIEPPQYGPQYRSINDAWPVLKPGLDTLFEAGRSARLTPAAYMAMYDAAYKLCMVKCVNDLHSLLSSYLWEVCEGTYRRVAATLEDPSFLATFAELWARQRNSLSQLAHITSYLKRFFEQKGTDTWEPIETTGMKAFGRSVLFKLDDKIPLAFCQAYDALRAEHGRSSTVLKDVVSAFVAVGGVAGNSRLYESHIEAPLLESTYHYFWDLSVRWLQELSVPEYMKRVATAIEDEHARSESILQEATWKRLKERLHDALVRSHIDELKAETRRYLQDSQWESLALLYKLLEPVDGSLASICTEVAKWVAEECAGFRARGEELIKSQVDMKKSPEVVQRFQDFARTCEKVLQECVGNDKAFRTAIDGAFRGEFNKKIGPADMPEMLAFYVDNTLRTRGGADAEEEAWQAALKLLVGYLNDRDMFLGFYRRFMSRRLLTNTSSEELERAMLVCLRDDGRVGTTFKLEAMMNDLTFSSALTSQYRESGRTLRDLPFQMDPLVLNQTAWPFNKSEGDTLRLPATMNSALADFAAFFERTHGKRRLVWLFPQSAAVVTLNFGEKRFDIRCSTLQACVLLCLANADSVSIVTIAAETGMSVPDLLVCTEPLCSGRFPLLSVRSGGDAAAATSAADAEGSSDVAEPVLSEKSVVSLNEGLPGLRPPRQFNVPPAALRAAQPKANAELQKQVMEERRVRLDAAVMRVMKARRRMNYNDLCEEVAGQLARFFVVDSKAVRRSLEQLVEREYLERDETDLNMFTYIA